MGKPNVLDLHAAVNRPRVVWSQSSVGHHGDHYQVDFPGGHCYSRRHRSRLGDPRYSGRVTEGHVAQEPPFRPAGKGKG